jgi:hypothetical protein
VNRSVSFSIFPPVNSGIEKENGDESVFSEVLIPGIFFALQEAHLLFAEEPIFLSA